MHEHHPRRLAHPTQRMSYAPSHDAISAFFRTWHGKGLRQLLLGLLLACLAFGASIGLLGLAGWFISTAALVTLLGITTFSYLIPSAGVRAFALLRIGTRYGERVITHHATFSWLARLRTALFAHAAHLPPAVMARFRSADLLDRAMSDVDTLDQVILRVVTPTISTALVALGCILFLATESLGIATLVALTAAAAGVGLPALASRLGRAPGMRHGELRTHLRTELIEALEGSREIATYGAEGAVSARLVALVEGGDRAQSRMRRLTALGSAASLLFSGVALLGVLSLGLLGILGMAQQGRMGASTIAMIALITIGLFEGIEALPLAYQQLGVVRRAMQRIDNLFSVSDATPAAEAGKPFPPQAELRLRDVSFCYGADEAGCDQLHDVIQHISLTIPAGALVTIGGQSGAGKTTLLRLIAGELAPTVGEVALGATPIATIDTADFWRHVGYVAQDSYVFSGTIRENLRLASPGARKKELFAALETVGLAEFVAGRDGGLDAALGEGGDRLSGGQRRRLCIARALLRRPELLLLDEPTAGVDRDTAEHMLNAIRVYLPTSTIIIATHDPLPRMLADRHIIVGDESSVSTRDTYETSAQRVG